MANLQALERELFDGDDIGSPGSNPGVMSDFAGYRSALEKELESLAYGEKPYRVASGLSRDGNPIDARIDLYFDKSGEVLDYTITLDEKVEGDEGRKAHSYAHEIVHTLLFKDYYNSGKDEDKEEKAVHYMTGRLLREIGSKSGDIRTRQLASRAYKYWLGTSELNDVYNRLSIDESGTAVRYQGGQGDDGTKKVAHGAVGLLLSPLGFLEGTVRSFLRNYGLSNEIDKVNNITNWVGSTTNYAVDRAIDAPKEEAKRRDAMDKEARERAEAAARAQADAARKAQEGPAQQNRNRIQAMKDLLEIERMRDQMEAIQERRKRRAQRQNPLGPLI